MCISRYNLDTTRLLLGYDRGCYQEGRQRGLRANLIFLARNTVPGIPYLNLGRTSRLREMIGSNLDV
jgi:hypothetical protein